MQVIQVFGIKGSHATRAAERFFKERGIKIQAIDLRQKAMAQGELKRFIDKFKLAGLIDTEGKSYSDAGLKYLKISDTELIARIEKDPRLLRLPLVRASTHVSIGHDEDTWKQMVDLA